MSTIGEHLSEAELSGGEYPRILDNNYIAPARENRYWHPAMESKIRELWRVSMLQERLPESMENLEEDMLVHLVRAWEAWKAHFR